MKSMAFENKLKRMLREGQLAFGAVSQLPSTALVEILGLAGFDFVFLDTEHGQYSIETAADMIRVAEGVGLTPLLRVAKNDETLILKALDLGAQGVVVPHIITKEDAIKAVQACKYGPGGSRGACPLIRTNRYGLGQWDEYQEAADRETMVFALVEDMEAMPNIEQILDVEGLDAVVLGAFDMAVGSGHKGEVQHEEVVRALDKVLLECNTRGIPAMHVMTSGPNLQAWIDKGVRMICQTSESAVFANACESFLESMAHLGERKSPYLQD